MLRRRLALVITLLACSVAHADVTSAEANGFRLRQEVDIKAPPAVVWRALLEPSKWWNPRHTYTGDAANIRLDASVGGCLCETLAHGMVEYLRVVEVDAPATLVLRGGLGPMSTMGVTNAWQFELQPAGDGTKLISTFVAGDYAPADLRA